MTAALEIEGLATTNLKYMPFPCRKGRPLAIANATGIIKPSLPSSNVDRSTHLILPFHMRQSLPPLPLRNVIGPNLASPRPPDIRQPRNPSSHSDHRTHSLYLGHSTLPTRPRPPTPFPSTYSMKSEKSTRLAQPCPRRPSPLRRPSNPGHWSRKCTYARCQPLVDFRSPRKLSEFYVLLSRQLAVARFPIQHALCSSRTNRPVAAWRYIQFAAESRKSVSRKLRMLRRLMCSRSWSS